MNIIKITTKTGNVVLTHGKNLTYKQLTPGMWMSGSYNHFNRGTDYMQFNYFVVIEHKYNPNETRTTFNTWKHVQEYTNVKTLKEMDAHGFNISMNVTDLQDGDSGDWYYEYEGRFCRGSGAEALSFVELITIAEYEKLEEMNRLARIRQERIRRITQLENSIAKMNDELVALKAQI